MDERRVLSERWHLTYEHGVGQAGSLFFDMLRREGRLMGRQVPGTALFAPPSSLIWETQDRLWSEIGPMGTLDACVEVSDSPRRYIACVTLDRAAAPLINELRLDAAPPRPGENARVRAVFAQERSGTMADFWFEMMADGDDRPA